MGADDLECVICGWILIVKMECEILVIFLIILKIYT